MKDMRGVDISVGDKVVYPVRKGSWMDLREADVLAVDETGVRIKVQPSLIRPSWVKELTRVAVVRSRIVAIDKAVTTL